MPLSCKHILPFLSVSQNRMSRWLSYVGLGVGVLLLLCCLQVYININQLLKDRNPRKDGFDYISVTKLITNENMGQDHSFSDAELKELKTQPFIEDATPLQANKFLVKATGPSSIPFTTDMFLESIDNSFIDSIPKEFTWKEGDEVVPVIISADYLELYNTVFAPSKDLPQFSEKTIGAVMVQMECYSPAGDVTTFRAHVVGLSDRINSVLVPVNFLQWANKNFSSSRIMNPSRIFIKIKDANNPVFLDFLQKKNYNINKDKTKFGRIKQVLQAIVSGLSAFGVLVILLAMVLFSFYLQLMIAKSKDNLQLLLTLGYSPKWLSKTVAKRWVPVYIIIVLSALAITIGFQYYFQHFAMNGREELSTFIHWSVAAIAMGLLALSIIVNYRMVSKLLHKL
ncbi:MAG: FtsX-like permease family protein [Bacteroidota bacterium]